MAFFGKYEVLEQIGKGSTATVYRAKDNVMGREVALKVFDPALVSDPVAFARFVHEAQASASLFHENIATALDSGEIEGRFYIAMRFVPGVSLDRILKKNGALSWNESLKLVRQIGNALAYAHAHGFLHRDIKPANIIQATDGTYVLTDFGLAKAYFSSGLTTRTGVVLGTPSYIPPEIWDGQLATPASDIYSLACLLFEALTGQVLFYGDTPYSIMGSHAKERHFPEEWPQDVPAGLTPVLKKALAVQSSERYQAVSEFMADLEMLPIATSQPESAPQPIEATRVEQIIQPEPKGVGAETPVQTPQVDQLPQPEPISENISATGETSWEEQKAPGEPKPEVVEASAGVPVKEQSIADKQSWVSWRKAGIGFIILAGFVGAVIDSANKTTQRRIQAENYTAMVSTAQTTTAVAQEAAAIATQDAVAVLVAVPTKIAMPTTLASPTTIADDSIPPACTELGQEWVSPIDGMTLVCIPAGEFTMGSKMYDDEYMVHDGVYLDAFWIDQTEVTNAQFDLCVVAAVCSPPISFASRTRRFYYGNSEFNNYPVINIDWQQAVNFCIWAEQELPTEAQWEKAARSEDGRIFPWGNDAPNSSLVNYLMGDTVEVGRYPEGVSPYGAFDMAGNVSEWVMDWYGTYPFGILRNPTGPITGEYRVLRGGSWLSYGSSLHTSDRVRGSPDLSNDLIGFRCARNTSP